MSEKRRDNRNRILHDGEYQQADGRYRFSYKDLNGERKCIYSWRLDKNDPNPKGRNEKNKFSVKIPQIIRFFRHKKPPKSLKPLKIRCGMTMQFTTEFTTEFTTNEWKNMPKYAKICQHRHDIVKAREGPIYKALPAYARL